jgi:2-hydroxycyclohexanecarboxyl-CoA dehydrogenase
VTGTQERVALVTGGAGGIGSSICQALANRGHSVIVTDLDLAAAQDVAAKIDGLGVALDVTDPDQTAATIASAMTWRGEIGILVNCAGLDVLRPFHETDDALQNRLLNINLAGPLRVTRHIIPGMLTLGWGRIINISSEAGRLGGPLEVYYSASKAGLIGATKALAREYARNAITVNCVSPGPTDTPLLRGVTDSSDNAETAIRRMTKAIPMARLGSAEDISAAVAYFSSDEASYVTGQTLSVSGGLSMV